MLTARQIIEDPSSFQACTACGGSGTYETRNGDNAGALHSCSICKAKGQTFTNEARKQYRKLVKKERAERENDPFVKKLREAVKGLHKVEETEYGYVDQPTFEEKRELRTREFLESIAGKFVRWGEVSEKAKKAALAAVDRIENPPAEEPTVPVPTGKVDVVGEIITIKEAPGYGYYDSVVLKMLVKSETGFKVYGTLPRALCEAEKGTKVQFTATLEQSKDDAGFGFFKRPTRAVIL